MRKLLKKCLPLLILAAAVFLLDIGCPIRKLTGFPCPGCGMTRACLAALRLNFAEAFRYHPLWILPVPLFLLSLRQPLFKNKRLENAFWWSMALLVLGTYLVRMLLFFPHTPPMDYGEEAFLYRMWKYLSG
ncbi:MAG: DUF2752 domain-containing protein [Oscillospiraceae bacterium]|nr:DUF2752 domain-containing protein [Oscillospiraceae bacterium]